MPPTVGLQHGEVLGIERRADGVAVLTLQRPQVHNAADEALIAQLHAALLALEGDAAVRVVVLRGAGPSFCAGADLGWMQRAAAADAQANTDDARNVATLLWTLGHLSKPTVALVHGKAFGLGVGLAACCDIAITSPDAEFAMAEVRFGLVPATVGLYVAAAVGERQARRWFLTGERIAADKAQRAGLVHELVPHDRFDDTLADLCGDLLLGAPGAQADIKALVPTLARAPRSTDILELTVRHIAAARASPEGREGMAAFLEKRKPSWVRRAGTPPAGILPAGGSTGTPTRSPS